VTKADGLSDFWLTKADKQIKLPMRCKIDSLNVSGSCAIMVFEVGRQRGFEE
jgi:TrmH family RNA methyltransferase